MRVSKKSSHAVGFFRTMRCGGAPRHMLTVLFVSLVYVVTTSWKIGSMAWGTSWSGMARKPYCILAPSSHHIGGYPSSRRSNPDLTGVQHLVVSAPQERQQLRLRKRMRMRNGLIQFGFVQASQFPKHLAEQCQDFRLSRVRGGTDDEKVGQLVSVIKIDPETGEEPGLLATGIVGE